MDAGQFVPTMKDANPRRSDFSAETLRTFATYRAKVRVISATAEKAGYTKLARAAEALVTVAAFRIEDADTRDQMYSANNSLWSVQHEIEQSKAALDRTAPDVADADEAAALKTLRPAFTELAQIGEALSEQIRKDLDGGETTCRPC